MNKQLIKEWLDYCHERCLEAELYYGHGTDNAWDESVQLVLSVMGLPLDSGDEVLAYRVSESQAAKLRALIDKRIQERVPVPYLLNQAWFMSMPFYVDERVLIPRSLMGRWLEDQLVPFIDPKRVTSICEVGTGSGCIAIAAAHIYPQAQVDALDISQEALAVAAKNVDTYEVADRVSLIASDCFSALTDQQYDLILSNPPYVHPDEMCELPKEYTHEPELALVADDEGLAIVMRILKEAPRFLKPEGLLVVETGYSDETLMARFKDAPWVWLDTDADCSGLLCVSKESLEEFWRGQ